MPALLATHFGTSERAARTNNNGTASTPGRPTTPVGRRARACGEQAVVSHPRPPLAEPRVEYRVIAAGLDARGDLGAREADLAVLARELPGRPHQRRHVVDQMPRALHQPGNDVEV